MTGLFAQLLCFRCHRCKGKSAAWGQGGGQIDGLTDTAEGAENLCMQGSVNPCVCVCVCDVRERAHALVHVKSSVVLHWDAQLILCQNNLQLPDACTVFSFFSINVSELVCYLNMGDWTLCHTRGCPSGDCKGAQTKTKFDWPAFVWGGVSGPILITFSKMLVGWEGTYGVE